MSQLDEIPGAEPVLQIVHVSDLHVVAAKHQAVGTVRRLERLLDRAGWRALLHKLRDGTAPHDPFAPLFFRRFLRQIAASDPVWSELPTWLVDTGDQTTYGDIASLNQARRTLASFAAAGGPRCVALANLHGNHDAWPEDYPLFAPERIAAHTESMARPPLGYAVKRAQAPLRVALPSRRGEIRLFTLDTVDERVWPSSWARGLASDAALAALAGWLTEEKQAGLCLRILATHHPVRYPPPRPPYEMVMANEAEVGERLRAAERAVQLILSGHTHALFPLHGDFARAPAAAGQLVVGTLMQLDRYEKRGDHPHQCQVLRFYEDAARPGRVLAERRLAARNPYADPPQLDYRFVPVPGSGSVAETLRFTL